jgi:porin
MEQRLKFLAATIKASVLCTLAGTVFGAERTPAPASSFGTDAANSFPFGTDARDQYTVEAYYRLQLAEHLAITPDIQLIKDPALNPDDDFVWIAGIRARLSF